MMFTGKNTGRDVPRWFILVLGLILALGFWAHTFALNLDTNIASRGFSILEVLQAHNNTAGFSRDYPGGARLTTTASPTAHLYLLGDNLGIGWMPMLYFMIFLEMCILLSGAWLLWLSLTPNIKAFSQEQRSIFNLVFVWIAALLLLSNVQRANLANFGFPVFHGQFYGFADGLRLAVLAMVLRNRWINAAVFFVLCFAVHPIKAVMVAGFSVPIVLYNWRNLFNLQFLAAVIASGIGVSIWSILFLRNLTGDQSVPLDDFLSYTRTFQFHWYPIEIGLFGDLHLRGITPFLALLLVTWIALTQEGWNPDIRGKLKLGLGAAVILTAIGVYVSVDASSAALIRLSPIRASNLVSLVAPMIIATASFLAWQNRDWLATSGYFAFLATSFTTDVGHARLPAVFALLFAVVIFYKTKKVQPVSLVATIAMALAIVFFASSETGWESALSGVIPATLIFCSVFGLLKLSERFNGKATGKRAPIYVLTVFAIVGALNFTLEKTGGITKRAGESKAYKETQVWANTETSETALFMVDPCRWYGWRDFSGRASLGTVREWYMTAWVYTDSGTLLEKGKQIARTLGFDMEPFRDQPRSYKRICQAARNVYYDRSMAGQSRIADSFDVDYFVFENEFATHFLSELQDRADFHNEYFTVVSAERLK